jgi:glutathione S-transferase
MKLYYSPGTCSLAPHIILHETGLPFEKVKVNLATHQTEDGGDYYKINSRGQVPLLQLDDGTQLTEGAVICQYLADKAGASALLPACGDPQRYQVASWQNYIGSELHKGYSPFFNPQFNDDAKAVFRAALRSRYEWLNRQLAHGHFLCGEAFTVADAYLFTVTNWSRTVGLDLADLEHLQRLMATIKARPAVQAAMKAEGLIK